MKFTIEELELIKDVLTDSLSIKDFLDSPSDVIRILDRIDEETDLD